MKSSSKLPVQLVGRVLDAPQPPESYRQMVRAASSAKKETLWDSFMRAGAIRGAGAFDNMWNLSDPGYIEYLEDTLGNEKRRALKDAPEGSLYFPGEKDLARCLIRVLQNPYLEEKGVIQKIAFVFARSTLTPLEIEKALAYILITEESRLKLPERAIAPIYISLKSGLEKCGQE